jgi:hypothetical protein
MKNFCEFPFYLAGWEYAARTITEGFNKMVILKLK